MLVIVRNVGEKLVINDDIEVVVLAIKGKSAKVGVQAPKSTTVYRNEIQAKILRERNISKSA